MVDFYAFYFFTHLIVFDGRQWCWAIKHMVLPFPFLSNKSKSFFSNLDGNMTASLALGIYLKPQSV